MPDKAATGPEGVAIIGYSAAPIGRYERRNDDGAILERRACLCPGGGALTLQILAAAGHIPYPPRVSEFTRTLWSALAAGRFLTTGCGRCGRLSFPPKPHCPGCWAQDIQGRVLVGGGKLYSFMINHVVPRAFVREALYALGTLDLEEGVHLICRLLDRPRMADTKAPVELVAIAYADGPLFAGRLASRVFRSPIGQLPGIS